MHAATLRVIFLLASQFAQDAELSPAQGVQFDPIPLREAASPRGEPTLAQPRPNMFRAAPPTPIERELNAPHMEHERSQVTRVSGETPLAAAAHEEGHAAAPGLLKSGLTPFNEITLDGQPITLYEALERVPERGQQLTAIKSYWRLTARLAEFHWAVKEAAYLAALPAARTASDQSQLHAARAAAEAREYEAKLAAVAAQYELAETARLSANAITPVPRDVPLVGAYRSKYDVIFANRSPPSGIRRVARMLPLQHQTIDAQAAAVTAAADAVHDLQEAHKTNQATLRDVLDAHDRLSRHRQAFLATVRDYNHAVADYSLAVIGTGESRQTIVSTLIRSPATTRSALAPNPNSRTSQRDRPQLRPAPRGTGAAYDDDANNLTRPTLRRPGTNDGAYQDDRPRIRFQPPADDSPREFGSRPAAALRDDAEPAEDPRAIDPIEPGGGTFRAPKPGRFRAADE